MAAKAMKSEAMQSAVVTVRDLTAQERVRLQCEARERYRIDQLTMKCMLKEAVDDKKKAEEKAQRLEKKAQKAEARAKKAEIEKQEAEERIRQDMARRMLQTGKLTVEEIAGCLGMSAGEVAALRDDEK